MAGYRGAGFDAKRTTMPVEVSDYPDIAERAASLGLGVPSDFCILPRRFESAGKPSDLIHESAALDVKALLRSTDHPIAIYQPSEQAIPFVQENDISWTCPVLFFGISAVTENPNLIGLTISIIANYVTDLFKGCPEEVQTNVSVIIEESSTAKTTKVTKKYTYSGPADKLGELTKIIKATGDQKS